MTDEKQPIRQTSVNLEEFQVASAPPGSLQDAALEKAIPAALMLAFMNSGQACAAGTRLLVPKSRFDAVKRAILDTMASFPVGDPADPKTAVGPMVSQNQYDRVQSYRISAPRKLIIVSSCFSLLVVSFLLVNSRALRVMAR